LLQQIFGTGQALRAASVTISNNESVLIVFIENKTMTIDKSFNVLLDLLLKTLGFKFSYFLWKIRHILAPR
jgi:hypothetical protein